MLQKTNSSFLPMIKEFANIDEQTCSQPEEEEKEQITEWSN